MERVKVRVVGRVQGVGFRPWVHGRARALGLTGFVLNDAHGVLVEAQGERAQELVHTLRTHKPPGARVDGVDAQTCACVDGEQGFEIRHSSPGHDVTVAIGPDLAPCDACVAEMFTPQDPRYLYPFINCTHCGPRYTITRALPYDRVNTSMDAFPMCAQCRAGFVDPENRRFHAQPVACPVCGPRVGVKLDEAWACLRDGGIVALKGAGGFQLLCDANSDRAVERLRARKHRDAKPFAVMVANVESAASLAVLDDAARVLLLDPARPVVVLPRGTRALASGVAPGLSTLGLMLPSTPLHHLLFFEALGRPQGLAWLSQAHPLAFVATSANVHGEPLITSNAVAAAQLKNIADVIVDHNRDIVTRVDDSVVRPMAGAPRFLRRARGHVPDPVPLATEGPCVVALGGHLKTTVTVTRGREAFVSQHVGSLDNDATRLFLRETLQHLQSTLAVTPQVVAHDLHPDFHSTTLALELGVPTLGVQHHHAHAAAVLAEHRVEQPTVSLLLDGFGLGDDGGLWGGELLLVDRARYTRLGHLRPLRLPGGGDAAARQPWRVALSAAVELGEEPRVLPRLQAAGASAGMVDIIRRGVSAPWSSSAGRLFDAASALLGVCLENQCEAQAAMLLESLVTQPVVRAALWRVMDGPQRVLDVLPLLRALLDCSPSQGADLFHGTLAAALLDWAVPLARQHGGLLALGGGCFLNAPLTQALVDGCAAAGVRPLLPLQVPVHDGGLSLGQARVAQWSAAR